MDFNRRIFTLLNFWNYFACERKWLATLDLSVITYYVLQRAVGHNPTAGCRYVKPDYGYFHSHIAFAALWVDQYQVMLPGDRSPRV